MTAPLSVAEKRLLDAAIRFNRAVIALVMGVVSGGSLWLATAFLLLKGGSNAGAHLGTLEIFFPGYSMTWRGAWIGFAWGFLFGAVSGAAVYAAYARALQAQLGEAVFDPPDAPPEAAPTLTIAGHKFGLAVGTLLAVQLILGTGWILAHGSREGVAGASLLAQFLPGYSVSVPGSLIGAIGLFVFGYLAARVVAAVYNRVARPGPSVPRRRPLPQSAAVRPIHVAILGAGPAGLATAHELVDKGERVTVLEQNGYVGGLCRTVEDGGYRFDLGGHRWFTKNEDLNAWFRRLMKGELVLVKRTSRIYYGGKYYLYPVTLRDVLRNAGPLMLVRAVFSFLLATLKYGMFERPIRNMKDAYVAQFGEALYELFFRRYSEKVWGTPCEELSADWVGQRSKGLSIWSIAREALANRRSGVRSLIEYFMYPRDGYMRIPERMADAVRAAGNKIVVGSRVMRIACHGPHRFEVFFSSPGGERSVVATHVVSTIPLGALAQMLTPQAPGHVVEAARGLRFRDLITVNVKLARPQVTSDTWLYLQDEAIVFGRLHEPKNWSRAMVPDDAHTSLVLECFCSEGDALWSLSDDQVAARCVADLVETLGFIEASEVLGCNVVRTRHAYPIYDPDYSIKIATIKAHLDRFAGLHVVGRGGAFRYNNADHSIEMGLMLARRILGHDVDPLDVNSEAEYHEEVRRATPVRDHYVLQPSAERSAS